MILLLEAAGAAPVKPKETVREDASPAPETPPNYGSPSGVYETIDVVVPDIGGFKDVAVIEVHAALFYSIVIRKNAIKSLISSDYCFA